MEHELETRFDRWRRHGDLRALEQVFDGAAPELLKVALHLTPGASEAEDLVQGTFLRALERAAQFDARRALIPWLVGILVHEAARTRRERARVVDPERLPERVSVDPAHEVADGELAAELLRAVHALPEPYRGVVEAHVLGGERSVDIAARLERAPGTVRMQLLRGLELLKKALPPSLATAALLSSGTRGHAAVKAAVLARAAELVPLAPAPEPARTPARGSSFQGSPMLASLAVTAGAVSLAVLAATRSPSPDPAPSPRALPAPVQAASAATLASARTPAGGGGSGSGGAPSAVVAPRLTGQVLAADGSPVAGVPVELVRPELDTFSLLDLTPTRRRDELGTTLTDAEGRFEFAVEAGQPHDVSTRSGSFSAFASGQHAGSAVTLRLAPDRRLDGRVLTPSGTPAQGAVVQVRLAGGGARKLRTTCDAEGRYELLLPAGQDPQASVTHAAGSWWDVTPLAFDAAGECTLDVRLAHGTTLRGTVTDARTGAPIEGALVGESWTFQRAVSTAADGSYSLPGCVSDYHYHVRAPGYAEAYSVTPASGEVDGARLDFALRPACAAHGRVVDEHGDGVADAYVALTSGKGTWSSTRSAADGSFSLEGLVPAEEGAGYGHTLIVGRSGFATQVHDLDAENAAGLHELPALTLRAPELVAGQALGTEGRPVAGARITLAGWNQDRYQWGQHSGVNVDVYVGRRDTLTDSDGRFSFGDVPPGRYELSGLATGRAESEGQDFVLAAGEPREALLVRFSNGGGSARIFGRVVDEAGNPLAGVRIAVDRADAFDVYLPSTDTAADGTFELGGLLEGPFDLWATGRMLARESDWIDARLPGVSGGPHELVLSRGATIEGRLVQPDGAPAIGRQVAVHPDAGEGWVPQTSDLLGRFRLLVPRDTSWTIDVYDSSGMLLSVDGVAAGSHNLVWVLPR